MALAQERIAQALNDAYAAQPVGTNILGTDFSVDIVLHWGAGAYIVGEETALIESARRRAGHAPPEAAVLPGRQGPVHAADHRQQRRDAGQPAVDHQRERPGVPRHRRAHQHRACACSRSAATSTSPACSRCPTASPRSAMLFEAPSTAAASATAASVKAFIPGGGQRHVVLRRAPRPAARQAHRRQGRLDARLGRDHGDGRHHRHGRRVLERSSTSSPARAAASARRAARAPRGSSGS